MVIRKIHPYWGRLAFLRVMATIPDDQIERLQLHRVGCVLLKDPAFNARSFSYESHGLIGLNYALEPILKGLNRLLLHFFSTEHIAGPQRMERVWSGMAPVAAHFFCQKAVPVNLFFTLQPLLGGDMAAMAHSLTASQVDFVVRHELGHLALDHGKKLKACADQNSKAMLQREFEFAADAFAQSSLRSALYSELRKELSEHSRSAGAKSSAVDHLERHQAEVTGARLLLVYMDSIEKIAGLLSHRIGHRLPFRQRVGTHPAASERAARLDTFHVGEYPPTSKLLRYATDFFNELFRRAEAMDDETLMKPLKELM